MSEDTKIIHQTLTVTVASDPPLVATINFQAGDRPRVPGLENVDTYAVCIPSLHGAVAEAIRSCALRPEPLVFTDEAAAVEFARRAMYVIEETMAGVKALVNESAGRLSGLQN